MLTYVVVLTLGYGEAGILSLAMSIGNSLSTIATFTMRNYQVSDINGTFTQQTYLKSRYITSIASMLICLIFVIVNGYSPNIAICILVYMLFKISEALSDVYQGILQKCSRMDYIGISFIIKGIAEFIGFASAIILTKDLLVALCILCTISYLVVLLYDRKKASRTSPEKNLPCSIEAAGVLLRTCLPLALFGLLFNTMGQAPRYFLEMQSGAETLGIYASVAMPVVIVQVSASFIFAPLTTPFASYLDKGELDKFKRLFKKVTVFIVVLSAIALVAFGMWGKSFLVLLLGDSISDYGFLIMPLVACTILTAISWFLSTVLVVVRKLIELLLISVGSFLIIVIGSMPMIEYAGINGTSLVLIIALLFFVAGNAIVLIRTFREKAKLIARQ